MGGREDLWKVGWSEINLCIKCDEGQNLLVCSENDCLLAVHEKCMGCPARFDDAGNFYCPHCFHRHAVRESRQAWENAMSKKRALSIFEMVGSKTNMEKKKSAEANGLMQSKGDEDVNVAAFHVGKRAQGSDVLHQSVGTDKDAQGSIQDGEHVNMTAFHVGKRAQGSDVLHQSVGTDEDAQGSIQDDEHVNMTAFHVGKRAQGSDVLHQAVGTDRDAQGSIHGACTANFSEVRGANESRREYKSDTIKHCENSYDILRDMEPIVALGNDVLCGDADRTSQQDRMLDRIGTGECVDSHKLNKINGDNGTNAFTKDSAQVHGRSVPSRRQLDNVKMHEEHKLNTVEEGSAQEEVSQSSRGSSGDELAVTLLAGSKRRLKRNDTSGVDSETVSETNKSPKPRTKSRNELKSQKRNPPRMSSSALRNIKEFDEQVGTSRSSSPSLTPPVNLAPDLFVGGKRKPLMWRKDEEEMLKEGVQKFTSTEKQNLPWRKILEFGRHVFDQTRTPVDLKDKWRNLLAR